MTGSINIHYLICLLFYDESTSLKFPSEHVAINDNPCVTFLNTIYNQIPDKKQVQEEKHFFTRGLEATIHQSRQDMAAEPARHCSSKKLFAQTSVDW